MSWKGVFANKFPKEVLQQYIAANDGIVNSTVFQGTLYELTVVRELMDKLRIGNMQVVGGSYDGGIDIRGKWDISPLTEAIETKIQFEPLPKRLNLQKSSLKPWRHKMKPGKFLDCYVQCKAFSSDKVTGRQVRETIGAFAMGVPITKRNSSIMIMSSPTLFTRDGIRLFNEANIPMIFTQVEMIKKLADGSFDVEDSGQLQHYYENDHASKLLANCGIKEWLKLEGYRDYE
ncbi:unnamed protein product [Kluyveromyces dobzhanskii CBS 2104]|uniref:Required for respiratory growth protein 7, mitochondrial n=1 Tax=Kluyveromyces dobzhanskii CBS 2104 TaxID=1427455 RepID=A0A0A8LBX7_9SACH|nr:unnamed protein product [Kluyveromyces dobzhanskii CBS 2104]